jgi:hypothetical protein
VHYKGTVDKTHDLPHPSQACKPVHHKGIVDKTHDLPHPSQACKPSFKGPGNTFDLNPKWSRTLPSLIYFSWDIYRIPLHKKKSNIKVDI